MERTGFEQWKPREVARLLALVETERRYYQEMVASLPVALVVLSGDRTVVSANRAFRNTVELRYEELRQKNIEQIIPSQELIERIRAAHVQGDSRPFFLNMGERRFRAAVIPIRSWEDETEAETLLMLENLAGAEVAIPMPPAPAPAPAKTPEFDPAAMPAVLWQADASTLGFTYVSAAAGDLLGYSPDQWIASPQFFSDRIHPEDRAEVMALFQAVTTAGGEASAEYRAVSVTGTPVWCRETIRVPAPGAGQRIAAGVLTAIGQRRQLEAQSLTAGRIDALRHLSARLAHDLNNPLMIVTGYGEEMLNSLPTDDPLRGDVAEMLVATGRVTEIAAQLLTFTRAQANPPVRISLRDLLAGLDRRLREQAREPIDLAIEDAHVWAYADSDQLEEAILTLAAGAVASAETPSAQPLRLQIGCQTELIAEQVPEATLKPGVYASITIHAGDSSAALPREVFESFLAGKDPRHSAEPATARAYLNVRQWGGDLLPSEGGFTIYLPYAEPDLIVSEEIVQEEIVHEEPPAPVAEEAPAPAPVEEPSAGTILIVEDEPGIRALVRKILRRERYEVLEAGSAEEALQISSSHAAPIDLLLTDVMLPAMSGRELAEALRRDRPELKVIYISGYTDDESVRAGDFPPGSKFLAKPFTLGALTGKVREAMEG